MGSGRDCRKAREQNTDAANNNVASGQERRRWPRQEQSRTEGPSVQGPPVLKPLEFSTRNLPKDKQFNAWQTYMETVAEYRLPDNKAPADGFLADHTAWNLGSVLIVQQRIAAHSYRRSTHKLRASPIDHWCIGILRSGRTWTEVDGHVAENEPGTVEFRTLGHPFWGRTIDAESVILYMPRDLFGGSSGVLEGANNTVISGNLAHLFSDYVGSVEASLPNLAAEDIHGIMSTLREMVIMCVSSIEHKSSMEVHGIGLMERARRYIRDNLALTELTPDKLSQELGISRTRLYQLFEPSGGVLHYIRRKRLLAAHVALSDTRDGRRISQIAEAAGFDTPANFSRAFKTEFGYSPREAREHAVAGHNEISPSNTADDRDSFGTWLTALGS